MLRIFLCIVCVVAYATATSPSLADKSQAPQANVDWRIDSHTDSYTDFYIDSLALLPQSTIGAIAQASSHAHTAKKAQRLQTSSHISSAMSPVMPSLTFSTTLSVTPSHALSAMSSTTPPQTSSQMPSQALSTTPPQTLSLEECLQRAREHYPLHRDKRLLDESLRLEITKLKMAFIPKVRFNGKVSYQSDVTTLPFDSSTFGTTFPAISTALSDYRPLTRDQYNINAEISAPLLDSLNLWANKAVVQKRYDIQKANIENELYKVQQSVLNVYFSSLLLDKQTQQTQTHIKELESHHTILKSRLHNGVIKQSDVDKIAMELLNVSKTLQALHAQKDIAISLLQELTDLSVQDYTLEIPKLEDCLEYLQDSLLRTTDDSIFTHRPELSYLTLKQEEAHLQKRVELSRSMPYIDAFFQGGYANPGLNILRSGFREYYIVGVRLNWDISNLYTKHQQDELIARQKLLLDSKKQEFLLQARLTLTQHTKAAQSLYAQLQEGKRIIALQERILKASQTQLHNGVISMNDFITDLHKLHSLRLEHSYQEIELLEKIFAIKQHLNEWHTLH